MDSAFGSLDQDFPLLVEAGLVAIRQQDEDSAMSCLTAAMLLRPKHSAPYIGFGYLHLNKLDTENALAYFEKALERDAENMLAKSFLAICYLLNPDRQEEGRADLNKILNKNPEAEVEQLCKQALMWHEKDLTKKKSLFF